MSRFLPIAFLGAMFAFAPVLAGQDSSSAGVTVRTFPLKSFSEGQAEELVQFYLPALPRNAMLSDAPSGWLGDALIVRSTPEVLTRIDSLLRVYDHPVPTLLIHVQLISALDSVVHDPQIAATEALLRRLLQFQGYRLLAQGAIEASGNAGFSLTLPGGPRATFTVDGRVHAMLGDSPGGFGGGNFGGGNFGGGGFGGGGAGGAVGGGGFAGGGFAAIGGSRATLNISLKGPSMGALPVSNADVTLFGTTLAIPLGQTIVLGTAAGGPDMGTVVLAVSVEKAPGT